MSWSYLLDSLNIFYVVPITHFPNKIINSCIKTSTFQSSRSLIRQSFENLIYKGSVTAKIFPIFSKPIFKHSKHITSTRSRSTSLRNLVYLGDSRESGGRYNKSRWSEHFIHPAFYRIISFRKLSSFLCQKDIDEFVISQKLSFFFDKWKKNGLSLI